MRLAVLLLANNHIIYSVESVYIYLGENGRKAPHQYKNVVVLEYLEISWQNI